MLRKISFGLLCFAASISTSSYAAENNAIKPQSIFVEYDLIPNEPQVFTNYMFWAIEANCKIMSEDESDKFEVVALAKKGKINGVPIAAGESLEITVHPNENLKIGADSGAKVKITNTGEHTVKASCTA